MKNTVKLGALALTVSLGIASCGSGGAPEPQKPAPETSAPPVTGGTIAVPADSTAAGEFVFTGVRARAIAQSLGYSPDTLNAQGQTAALAAGNLKAQAVQDELRVLLTVNRAKTGDNAGKKKAQATFVWGNQTELLQSPVGVDPNGKVIRSPGLWLSVFPKGGDEFDSRAMTEGTLELKVESPNFQDKTTKSSPYADDTGAQCARLMFTFGTARNDGTTSGYTPMSFTNQDAPLILCEGVAERDAEKVALEKATASMAYTVGSIVDGPFTYTRWDNRKGTTLSADELRAAVGAPAGAALVRSTFDAFFAPLTVLPAGDPKTWTPAQKEQAATAKKYINLQKQFGYYFKNLFVITVKTNAGRDDILILGENGWGVGGLKTLVVR
ncbi:nuclease A inhibitor family protein [Deinococcus taklimakanensis]|uniref:Nuclease A inhibitor family protein n=1 Tax=Deinococcus taklimakanensis TaxID=536443 RepID=A0ABW5P784_9DEIO